MFYPSLSEFEALAKNYNLLPVYKEILTDFSTPVSTFATLCYKKEYAYLLESAIGMERWGRYSFISYDPKIIFIIKDKEYQIIHTTGKTIKDVNKNPLDVLKKIMLKYKPAHLKGLPRFYGGAVGYIGYEMIANIEPKLKDAIDRLNDNLNFPTATFMFTDSLIIFDHFTHKTKIVVCVDFTEGNKSIRYEYKSACEKINKIINELKSKKYQIKSKKCEKIYEPQPNMSYTDFISKVKKIKEYIKSGEIIQAVFSQRFSKRTDADPFNIYRALRIVNPSPYMFYLNLKDFQLIGSSPEILVRNENGNVETRPIAGTRPRGLTEAQEKKLEFQLLQSKKEQAEHVMLVDLGRNDLSKCCRYATVRVPEFMIIEKYSHVIHIVSSVIGKLKPGADSFDVLYACFPAGTVTGAPKIRAMEIIAELELEKRGPYAGAVGYFAYSGNMDMAITIRTIIFKKPYVYIQAGAGIIADSKPEREYQEIKNKAQALLNSIAIAEKGFD